MKIWKVVRLFLVAVVMAGSVMPAAYAKGSGGAGMMANDPLFAGAEKLGKGAKESSIVNLDKDTMAMMGKDKDGMIGKMDFVTVYSFEWDKPGMYNKTDLDFIFKKLDNDAWSHIVSSHEKDEWSDIYIKKGTEGWSEMVVISAEAKELSLVHLRGQMSMDQLSKMGSKYGGSAPDASTLKRR